MKTLEKLAADILDEHGCPGIPFDENVTMYYPAIIEAMQVFHKHALEEWIAVKIEELEQLRSNALKGDSYGEGLFDGLWEAIEILKAKQ